MLFKDVVNSLELRITIDGQEESLENLLDPYIASADENVRKHLIKVLLKKDCA